MFADAVPVIFTEVSTVAALLTAAAGVLTFVFKVRQDRAEFRRKQAESARNIIDSLYATRSSMDALNMLDFEALTYEDASRKRTMYLTKAEVVRGLRTTSDDTLSLDDLYVRDSFDALLTKLEQVMSLLDVGLIRWDDISSLIGYYAFLVRRDSELFTAVVDYSRVYGFPNIVELIVDAVSFPVRKFRGADDIMRERRPSEL